MRPYSVAPEACGSGRGEPGDGCEGLGGKEAGADLPMLLRGYSLSEPPYHDPQHRCSVSCPRPATTLRDLGGGLWSTVRVHQLMIESVE